MSRGHRRTRTTWRTPTGHTWKSRKEMDPVERVQSKPKPVPQGTPSAQTWWWTVTKKTSGRCYDCAAYFAKGQVIAYNRDAGESLCELCADRRSLNPTPSKRFRASLNKQSPAHS